MIEECFSSSFEIIDFEIDEYTLKDLEIIFQLIPYDTENKFLLELCLKILSVFSLNLLDRNKDVDYSLRHKIFTKVSYFLLFRKTNDLEKYAQPFVDNYCISEETAIFFELIIYAEDKVERYEQFWVIWECFYLKIINNISHKNYDKSKVIHNYLLAWDHWKKTAVNWHSLKEKEKLFYKKVVKDIGDQPAVLDSVAKFLNEIGAEFLNEGVFWISDMILRNTKSKLETNTVYYIEKLTRKYIYLNRNKVKTEIMIKNKLLIILNFLIERGSVNAYLLREDIL